MLRRQPLLPFLAVLSTVSFAASDSVVTLTVPTLLETITRSEFVTAITLGAGPSIITTTARGRVIVATAPIEPQIILSTVTEDSAVLITTETILVTTIPHASSTSSSFSTNSASELNTTTAITAFATSSASSADATETVSSASDIANAAEQDDTASKNKGLTAGAIAGIVIGTLLAVLLVALIVLCFKAKNEARPRSSTLGLNSWSDDGLNVSPVLRTISPLRTSPMVTSEKRPGLSQLVPNEDSNVGPEEMIHPAYIANSRFSNDMKLTGIVYEDKNDQPMYVGVPTHLTGGERWSASKQ